MSKIIEQNKELLKCRDLDLLDSIIERGGDQIDTEDWEENPHEWKPSRMIQRIDTMEAAFQFAGLVGHIVSSKGKVPSVCSIQAALRRVASHDSREHSQAEFVQFLLYTVMRHHRRLSTAKASPKEPKAVASSAPLAAQPSPAPPPPAAVTGRPRDGVTTGIIRSIRGVVGRVSSAIVSKPPTKADPPATQQASAAPAAPPIPARLVGGGEVREKRAAEERSDEGRSCLKRERVEDSGRASAGVACVGGVVCMEQPRRREQPVPEAVPCSVVATESRPPCFGPGAVGAARRGVCWPPAGAVTIRTSSFWLVTTRPRGLEWEAVSF